MGLAVFTAEARAQDADVIRGRVTGQDLKPVVHAGITATALSGGVSRTALSDADGRYTITFVDGDGDYWVTVTAPGFVARRMEIKRIGDQQILVGDVKLARVGSVLDPVKIVGQRRQQATADTGAADIGGAELHSIAEVISADQLADLALLAGTFPGVQIVSNDGAPSGYSVLGLPQEQNTTTLNGMRFDGSALPRDAAFGVSLAVSPYDVSRGGFSGAQLALRSRPPSNLTLRANSLALDAPPLQWSDPAARALGMEYNNLSVGGVVTTPIERDRAFLHIAYQGGQRFNPLRTLLDASAPGLTALGVAPDSLARLEHVLQGLGVPLTVNAVPSERLSSQALVYGAVDLRSPSASSGRTLNVMYTGSFTRQAPAALLPTAFPAQSGIRNAYQGGVQLRHTGSFGFGVLSETQVALSGSHSDAARYLDLPSARVRVVSDLGDGASGVQQFAFGGSPALDRDQGTALVAATNQLSWFSLDNRHRLKLSSELSRESLHERLASNMLGTFAFNSLNDLEAGRPSSFTRQLASPRHDVVEYRAAIALGDAFVPTPGLQLQYGVRADVNRFSGAPLRNDAVQQAFGTDNTSVPNRIDVSPRLGFAWSYGSAHQVTALAGGAPTPRAVVRGGVGIFQGVPAPSSITSVLDNTGLPSAARQLTCAGPAAPVPEWSRYAQGVSNIPVLCADGAGAVPFVNAQPAVSVYARDFAPPRSLRSNVQWSGAVLDGRLQLQLDFTESYNLSQPGIIDRNFLDTPQFTLDAESGRPVFVAPANIDAATGAVAGSARRNNQFASVTELRSDLHSEARQFTLSIAPSGVHSTLRWSLAYVHSNIRDQVRGFTSTAGTPLTREWGRSSFDARHQFVYSIGYNLFDLFRVSWAGSIRSGLPFTPVVSGDINGDGRDNDRAFVFNPALSSDQAATAIGQLMLRASPAVRRCLEQQVGHVAQRNSCDGPWSSAASLNIAFNPVRWWRTNRLDVVFQVSNPLGAADLLLHGAERLHGWGQPPAVNDALYFVRGFDPATRRFLYDVNPRFGDASPSHNSLRAPVALTAIVRFDFGPTRERQNLTMQLDRGRRDAGTRTPEPLLRALLGGGAVFNPIAAILRSADSLHLTGPQADTLTLVNAQYARRVDAIWSPIIKQLTALPDHYNRDVAYELFVNGRRQTIDLLSELVPTVQRVLTPSQRRALPVEVLSHLDRRYLATIRSGTAGLGLAFLPGVSAPTGSPGAGGAAIGTRPR